MLYKKKWSVLNQFRIQSSEFRIEKLIKILLENRGLITEQEIESFIHPKLEEVTVASVGIDTEQLNKAIKRIQEAIENKEQIVVFGDYDVDGITGAAILWETLHDLGAKVMPYIPHRVDEGYGLSIKAIQNSEFRVQNPTLIITVDNGIVANEAVEFANSQGIDVIITDHHMRSKKDPDAFAIVHTTKLCGAAVGYLLAQNIKYKVLRNKYSKENDSHLELVALATVADLVPLTAANRTLVRFGLESLRKTKRVGLQALFTEAGVEADKVGVYEIGHVIGPRLNAMGRMANAMDSLRLLCTRDASRAQVLAEKLGKTNKERQLMTQEMAGHALGRVQNSESRIKNVLFVSHETYEQGVIGLVASKLVETYYRPSIVVSIGETVSKASARSIPGFNIIEFIRSASHLLLNAGGHPMAAGFSVETKNLVALQEVLEALAVEQVSEELLQRILKIDCELPLEVVNYELYDALQQLQPFGMANPEPTFASRGVIVDSVRAIGAEGKHLKLELRVTHPKGTSFPEAANHESRIGAIAFGMGEYISEIRVGDGIDISYTVDENVWNGNKKLQLKIKNIQINEKIIR